MTMAAPTISDTYAALKRGGGWMSGIEIASETGRGVQTTNTAAKKLVSEGICSIKRIDRRMFFKLINESHPLVDDIIETLEVMEK
jgi:hypothetical protein